MPPPGIEPATPCFPACPSNEGLNTTRINVGLARSYVKLLLSSWKTYMCNLMAWYINK